MLWNILIVCVLSCVLWPILPCGAQETRQADSLPVSIDLQSPDSSGPADPRELEAFLDPFFTRQINTGRLPGAVVVVVKDGVIFFAKGYGYANREQQTLVVPESAQLFW
jgi:CubicO group peptidase (beta-lactamase class C family)